MDSARPKLLFIVTEDWFFRSHFLDRALAAKSAGFDVIVAAKEGADAATIRRHGLRFLPLPFDRRSLNPLHELQTILAIRRLCRAETPAIQHHVALKPIIYGSLIGAVLGGSRIVNAPVGMGFVYTASTGMTRWLRPLVTAALRLLLNPKGSKVIVENRDDLRDMVAARLVRPEDAILIRGAGVDIGLFRQSAEPPGPPLVVLAGRMLWDKGIAEFVEAARLLTAEGIAARFVLVGAPDEANPRSASRPDLEAWAATGPVEWWGHRTDMPGVLAGCHIACLPSYREGLPKFLLEALASARPVVATDVAGCREAVTPGDNGLLVPPRDARALADALRRLIVDKELRARFGQSGRRRAELEFSSESIAAQTLAVYRGLLP